MIERPMQVTQLVKEALDNKFPPLSEALNLMNFIRIAMRRFFSGAAVLGVQDAVSSVAIVMSPESEDFDAMRKICDA